MSLRIAKSETYQLGRFTIIATPKPGSVHMLQFRIYLGDKLIATRMSRPSLADCEHAKDPVYVPIPRMPHTYASLQRKRGRPSKAEVEARKASALSELDAQEVE